MKILFFGTPEFSLPALEKLLKSRHSVVAVVTQPDRPKGRIRDPVAPPVKIAAENAGIPVFQPTDLADETFLQDIRQLRPEAAAVVAYGRLLPQQLLQIFSKGVVNLHASLLPKLRGAAPIQWALIRGESETGVTVFQLDKLLDHGPIILQTSVPIQPSDTAETLGQKLAQIGSETLVSTLDQLESGTAQLTPQKEADATYAPRLQKEGGLIRWQENCLVIHNRVRALHPWPGAMTWLGSSLLKIVSTHPDPSRQTPSASAGTIVTADIKEGLWVQTGEGQLRILRLQREGGKILSAEEFLRGHPIPLGATFSSKVSP